MELEINHVWIWFLPTDPPPPPPYQYARVSSFPFFFPFPSFSLICLMGGGGGGQQPWRQGPFGPPISFFPLFFSSSSSFLLPLLSFPFSPLSLSLLFLSSLLFFFFFFLRGGGARPARPPPPGSAPGLKLLMKNIMTWYILRATLFVALSFLCIIFIIVECIFSSILGKHYPN